MTLINWTALIKVLDVISLLTLLCVSHECQVNGNHDHVNISRLGMSRSINVQNILKLKNEPKEWENDKMNMEKRPLNATWIIFNENKQEMDFKRVRREKPNTTKESVQCEVASLSCRNPCGSSSNCAHKTAFCRCDPQCRFYNDCCVDLETFWGKTQEISFKVKPKQLSCIKLPNTGSESAVHIWTVNKCPETRLFDEIDCNCETADETESTTIQKLTPVVAMENNLIFRNEFCAKCDGFEKFEYFGF